MEIPRNLVLDVGKFPELQRINLRQLPECARLDERQVDALQLAVGLSMEALSNTSYFKVYLDSMPTEEDYLGIMPAAATPDLWAAFGSMCPVLTTAAFSQTPRKQCFWAWSSSALWPDEAEGIDWPQVQVSLWHIFSRGFPSHTNQGWWMVPAIDLLNTATVPYVNVGDVGSKAECENYVANQQIPSSYCRDYSNPDAHRVYTVRHVEARAELVHHYCPSCNNIDLLARYGFYMEDNPNEITFAEIMAYRKSDVPEEFKRIGFEKLDCEALWHVVKPYLNITEEGFAEAFSRGWRAPRCRNSVPSFQLRCTMSRISYEFCTDLWTSAGRSHGRGLRGPDPRDKRPRSREVIFEGDLSLLRQGASFWVLWLLALAASACFAAWWLRYKQNGKSSFRVEARHEARKDRKKKSKGA